MTQPSNREMLLELAKRCPHCQQRMPPVREETPPSRICRRCKAPIRVHHKWKVETDGEASWFEHRHCEKPESYVP